MTTGKDDNYLERCASIYARSSSLILVWYPLPWALNHSSTFTSSLSVTCCFLGMGLNPLRAMALANISGVISGCSDTSISSSRKVSTRSQSVWDFVGEFFEVLRLLIFRRFSYRNNANRFATVGVADRNYPVIKQSEGQETPLAIILAGVFRCKRKTSEDFLAVNKINSVTFDISESFLFIPFKSHLIMAIVVTFVNTFRKLETYCQLEATADSFKYLYIYSVALCCGLIEIADLCVTWNLKKAYLLVDRRIVDA